MPMDGSPFQFTVGPYRDHGAHLVKAGGAGLERGEQGEINEFNVWTREAGSGQLAISVEGPSKAEINFTDRKDGSCDVSYKVSEPDSHSNHFIDSIFDDFKHAIKILATHNEECFAQKISHLATSPIVKCALPGASTIIYNQRGTA
ncbi:hypothetical protein NQ317_000677 [Molorchus minor]|uniref:Uncharacterized protein n=1 Tax=Molorchus minor TaxID=1323400 RepID=A0ABQ9JDD3_9CUCU|nr:hypothetical protein NQ317_000677 [Molorchus minor]